MRSSPVEQTQASYATALLDRLVVRLLRLKTFPVVCLLVLLLVDVPAASANTGIGVGTYVFTGPDGDGCSADARFVISAEVGVGGGIAGDAFPCFFQPDRYTLDMCVPFPGGVQCSYTESGRSSTLAVYDSGDFVYEYLWHDGATDIVYGILVL